MTDDIQYFSEQELHDFIAHEGIDAEALAKALGWIERGDAAVIYRNVDLGHPDVGALKIASYGSPAAQIEATQFPDIPRRLPDIGSEINWRYIIEAVCDPQAFRAEFHGSTDKTWAGNALTFFTFDEADQYAYSLLLRWTGASEYRVVPNRTTPKREAVAS